MLKYLRYLISPITIIVALYIFSFGRYYPTIFIIAFSLYMVLGDRYLCDDLSTHKYSYPSVLNLILYLNLPILMFFILIVILVLGNNSSIGLIAILDNYLSINFISIKESFTIIDKIVMIDLAALFIAIMGTNVGHELTHRKRNKVDMFVGNWLLALSWDCAFAIEHVYGHHKNVCLSGDPATAKRGENIYHFILRAFVKEQKDAWKIEINHLK